MLRPVITLTTDFGLSDSYAGQMKGAMLRINPEAQFIDVTHGIPAQDVIRAAFMLDEIADVFPPGTIHVVVVDPGVGTERAILGIEMNGWRFVAPNNGVLSIVAHRHQPQRIVQISDPKFWRTDVSATFHGRDIMGPVAAHWSLGVDLSEFGSTLPEPLSELPIPTPRTTGDCIEGEVLYCDTFGNLITNIDETLLPTQRDRLTVEIAARMIEGIRRCYGDGSPGELLALIGSQGKLEISVNGGSAAAACAASAGSPVRVIGSQAHGNE